MSLDQSLTPCGPVLDQRAAARLRETLEQDAGDQGWARRLESAWPALEPVFAASPYLSGLARAEPARLGRILAEQPDARLAALLADTRDAGGETEIEARRLRRLKAEIHLLTAVCDLGGVWDLEQVTGALASFADAAVQAALSVAAREEITRGRLRPPPDRAQGPVPGLFCIAMGKHGGMELNYSSDIDVSVFYEPEDLPVADGVDPDALAVRLTQALARLMQDRTPDGYVFRFDLRLRPDPSVTPPAVPVQGALSYYETAGQNWERAAFIKARPCAGDIPRALGFLDELRPFIWRRSLDFAAIADIHSIKRQIHVHKADERLTAKGANLKLGAGGIREIEFFVQTQQLILGGRDPRLRSPRTIEALHALAEAGHVSTETAEELAQAYRRLRGWEHRIQMIADEQTHRLPEADAERRRVAALSGKADLRAFDTAVSRTLNLVNRRYGELFAEDEPLSSRFGSLVFTGVEDDPATLETLARMGYSNPAQVSGAIRAWHHGRIPATRTERGRELFTRLAPQLLETARATGAPDAAFNRFSDFFASLSAGVQVQSLLLARPELFELLVKVLAFAPRLARTLARRPAALDSLFDAAFFAGFDEGEGEAALVQAIVSATDFEAAMDAARRVQREQAFRIGVQVMSGVATAAEAGPAFADLADICIRTLAPWALKEAERMGGAFPGEVAVVALGKCGSREMTADSDLDLMTLYEAADPTAMSELKGWGAETFYARFTQRLVAALSAPTGEGDLYKVDLQLRPSGTSGPVAVAMGAFGPYYEGEAETWELLALTRARVVWASSADFADKAREAIEQALRRPRSAAGTAEDVRDMRARLARERPPKGFWDLKLAPGGLVDIEFAAQFLQIVHAADGGPLAANTADALAAMGGAGLAPAAQVLALEEAWRLQQDLSQLLKVALEEAVDIEGEPQPFRQMLARSAGARDFRALQARLTALRTASRKAYDALVKG
jgi:glutamate-ammonia-ligase adenylyltransferase